jgi:hypothetical protein
MKHTTTLTTTTTTKSSCCGSENFQLSCHKKTVRTVIMEDQMSTCSCGKKSIKGSEYGGSVYGGQSLKSGQNNRSGKDVIKSSNLSDISSLGEF